MLFDPDAVARRAMRTKEDVRLPISPIPDPLVIAPEWRR